MEEAKELNHIIDNIAAIRIAMLTTEGSDGTLHSRPMYTLEVDDQDRLWFFTNRETLKLKDIDKHQQVNLAYTDMHSHTYISISGKAFEHDDKVRKKELYDPAIDAWFPEGPESDDILLLVVEMENAVYWDTEKSRMVAGINFLHHEKK